MSRSKDDVPEGAETADRALGRAARGSVLNFAGAVVATVSNLGLTIVVARLASQDAAGAFFSATSLFLLANGVGQLGTNTALVYFLSGARARRQLSLAGAYMRTAAAPVLAVAVVVALLFLTLADPIGRVLSSGADVEFSTYLRGMALFLPFAAAANLALSGTRGLGTMRANAALDQAARPALQLMVVFLALMLDAEVLSAVGWSAVYVPTAVVSWWWWTRLRDRAAAGSSIDEAAVDAGTFWRFSAPRALAGVTQIAMQRLDIVLVGAMVDLRAAAIYAAATRFMVVGQMAAQAVSMAVQPQLGETLARGDLRQAGGLYRSSTAWLMLVTWPLYLSMIVFAPTVLEVFGRDYTAGGAVVVILCATMLFATGCGMVDIVLMMAGRTVWNLANVLAAFGVNLTLNLLLIPRLEVKGAAVAWAAAIVVANALPLAQVTRSLGLHPFGRETALAAAVSVVAFAAVPGVIVTVMGSGWHVLVLGGGLGLAVFAGLVYKLSDPLGLRAFLVALRGGRRLTRAPGATVSDPRD